MRRWVYLLKRWLVAHKPEVGVSMSVSLPEPDERVGNGHLDIDGPTLLKALRLPSTLTIMGVRWSSTLQKFRIAVRGSEIPACGGEIVSINPIHTEKEIRDARVAAELG